MDQHSPGTLLVPIAADLLSGSGALGKPVKPMEWAATPFGLIELGPQSLRTSVSLYLAAKLLAVAVASRLGKLSSWGAK